MKALWDKKLQPERAAKLWPILLLLGGSANLFAIVLSRMSTAIGDFWLGFIHGCAIGLLLLSTFFSALSIRNRVNRSEEAFTTVKAQRRVIGLASVPYVEGQHASLLPLA